MRRFDHLPQEIEHHLQQRGWDPSWTYTFRFRLRLPREENAHGAAALAHALGFRATVRKSDYAGYWLCEVSGDFVPRSSRLETATNLFRALAHDYNAAFEGWGALVETDLAQSLPLAA